MPVVYLGIGSNINRKQNISQALSTLKQHYGDIECSSVYETESYGFEGDDFYNLVARFSTNEEPADVKCFLRDLELKQGRPRNAKKYKPRTIDLDFLLYGDLVSEVPGLQLPREDILLFSFALEPLAELAPDEIYPESIHTYRELWIDFQKQKKPVKANKISWSP